MRFPCYTQTFYLPFAKSSAAFREGQRGRSRRAARSFAKNSAVVRERQIKTTSRNRKMRIMKIENGLLFLYIFAVYYCTIIHGQIVIPYTSVESCRDNPRTAQVVLVNTLCIRLL